MSVLSVFASVITHQSTVSHQQPITLGAKSSSAPLPPHPSSVFAALVACNVCWISELLCLIGGRVFLLTFLVRVVISSVRQWKYTAYSGPLGAIDV